jgi:hypothetical protein
VERLQYIWGQKMKIKFKQIKEDYIEIIAVYNNNEIKIGQIFSEGSYSGENSIQICGFDRISDVWSCYNFNHSLDCCLIWNNDKTLLKLKGAKDEN